MYLIPYRLQTVSARVPFVNYIVISLTTLMFLFVSFGAIPADIVQTMVLKDWDIAGMLGCLLLHGGIFHIVGNMLFLWVFGNAICAAVGNIAFPFVYLFLGLAASSAHLLFSGQPAIGASGAINGVVGMTLILFPVNKLDCFYGFSMPLMGVFWKSGKFTTKSFWMIGLWCVFDLIGILIGGDSVAHWAHLGGFVAGVMVACLLLLFKAVETYDPTLIEILTGGRTEVTNYSLEEAHAKFAPKLPNAWEKSADLLHQSWMGASDPPAEPGPAIETNVSPGDAGVVPVPVFRVLRVVPKDDGLMCYFVNEGDAIGDIQIESTDAVKLEIQPQKLLANKAPGWIHLMNSNQAILNNLKMKLSYNGEHAGRRISKQLTYLESEKKFLLA